MKKLREKNLPKALDQINKINYQSEELVKRQLNTKLILEDPKISEQELKDIQKFANSGMLHTDIQNDVVSKSGATALLMESVTN